VKERRARALDRHTEELLFRHADVLTEGQSRDGVWFGSTMIAFDLDAVEADLRAPLDAAARAELAALVSGSVRVRIRVMRMACAEVARRNPDTKLGTAQMETRVKLEGRKLHLDVDLEVPFGVSSARSR
jgi:hypothetical protein